MIRRIPEYYCDDPNLPILERIAPSRKRLYSVEDTVRIVLHPTLQSSKFASTKVPTSINDSVSFIVDLDRLDDQSDVLADDMGVWNNNGVDTTYVRVALSESRVEVVEKCGPLGEFSAKTYLVKRVYRTHGTDASLKKLTAYVHGEYK